MPSASPDRGDGLPQGLPEENASGTPDQILTTLVAEAGMRLFAMEVLPVLQSGD